MTKRVHKVKKGWEPTAKISQYAVTTNGSYTVCTTFQTFWRSNKAFEINTETSIAHQTMWAIGADLSRAMGANAAREKWAQ